MDTTNTGRGRKKRTTACTVCTDSCNNWVDGYMAAAGLIPVIPGLLL